ncbi:MAG: oligosaccharide flippase family protein [Synergistales bacterium]|nr:oligosaccharide flippase family protein [Bacteroidales bacterium]MDY6394631.1 oligosaccharide flippase family protein [Bacteroidales bacterium]MDY6395023.1 oligosaccharide flippase family protein [Bacteroidales bacterium]MDY6402990.1 oligosaccharide flippase family protein [Bacteroidales bacterium]MDY6435911.1 oligosaccharide flippase family protein [Synergistales bacterium]
MKKFFVVNLLFMLSLNLLIKSFWILGIDRSVQNALPSGEYGVYYALLNFSYLFNIILDFGINNFNNKTIAQNTFLLKKYFARILPLKLILAGVYIVAVFVVALIGGYKSRAFNMLMWLCLFQILTYFLTYFRSNISGLLLFKTDSILSILDKSLTIIFCSILLWTSFLKEDFKVEYFVYVQVLSIFISCVVALAICLTKTGFIKLVWNKAFMLAILKYGFPFALLSLLMSFYNRIDSVFLERLLDDNGFAAGVYASGFRLVDSANMVSYLFSVILLPFFAKLIKDSKLLPTDFVGEKNKNIKDIIKISFHLLLVLSMGFVLVSFLYSNELMTLLYNKNIEESAEVYRILCFCFIPVSTTYIFGTLLTANGSMKKLNIVAACGMVMNIVLNIILVPKYQQNGSAVSSLVSQVVTAILQVWIAIRIFNISFNAKYVTKIISFVLCITLMSYLVYNVELMWGYRIVITLTVIIILAFVFKVFSIKDITTFVTTSLKDKK